MTDYLEGMVNAIQDNVRTSVAEGLEQVEASLGESVAAVKSLEKSIKSTAIAEIGEHVKTLDKRWQVMGDNIQTITKTLEEIRDYRASVDKRLSALTKKTRSKSKLYLSICLFVVCSLVVGCLAGIMMSAGWARAYEAELGDLRAGEFVRWKMQSASAGERGLVYLILSRGIDLSPSNEAAIRDLLGMSQGASPEPDAQAEPGRSKKAGKKK